MRSYGNNLRNSDVSIRSRIQQIRQGAEGLCRIVTGQAAERFTEDSKVLP